MFLPTLIRSHETKRREGDKQTRNLRLASSLILAVRLPGQDNRSREVAAAGSTPGHGGLVEVIEGRKVVAEREEGFSVRANYHLQRGHREA